MLAAIAKKFLGSKNDREIKKMQPIVAHINKISPSYESLSDDELKAKTPHFKERLANGETLDDILPEAFATVREVGRRLMGMRHFDVQLIGGMVIHRGSIAEMKTGEGKTLTATLPLYLNALTGKGAWLVTVNDYLAKRDAEWMDTIYSFLGLSTGIILNGLNDDQRREAYAADITYGTNNEFGFDYLRDNMKQDSSGLVQRGFNFAIVDEVDSVLIDEARTPLIISGPAEDNTGKYYEANQVVMKLNSELHYSVDEKDRHTSFTEEGIAEAEKVLKLENLYDPTNIEILHAMEQSLKAHFLFKKDVDYIVDEDQVIIIDESTGRAMPGRRYSDGLHQALEAKEDVKIEKQNQTMASVTFQNFFRMFDKLSGMTGTAETEAAEFHSIYKLDTFVLPTNRPIQREDANDLIFATRKAKYTAILEEIKNQAEKGRPVLVGTIAIETSEEISAWLKKNGIRHVVLNAKYHASEADIVAQAGRKGAVTIATNMAGRGTDIVLGGNPEGLAKIAKMENPEADYEQLLEEYKVSCAEEKKEVLELGGLYIIGTERHESRRIDNQLRGRSGRQGDPGFTRFYLALEDPLMRRFGNEKVKGLLARSMDDDNPIEHKMVSKSVERAQKAVEARNFEARKHLLEYDDVMNYQRNTFYTLRRDLLTGTTARDYLYEKAETIHRVLLSEYDSVEKPQDEDRDRLLDNLRTIFSYQVPEDVAKAEPFSTQWLHDNMLDEVKAAYEQKWQVLMEEPVNMPEEAVRDQERFIMLYVVDLQWKDHMRSMDFLKEGIGLRGYAQKDPLMEYKRESLDLFTALMDRLEEEVVKMLLNVRPQVSEEAVQRMRRRREAEERAMQRAGKEEAAKEKPSTYRRDQPKVGRNDPCYCGSGKKFKKCHGKR